MELYIAGNHFLQRETVGNVANRIEPKFVAENTMQPLLIWVWFLFY